MSFTWANILTLFRIVITPLFLVMILSGDPVWIAWSTVLYFVGAISDYFDGYLARKFNSGTNWGKFTDPLADKILTLAALAAFVFLDIIPLWMVVLIGIRDLIITLMRVFGSSLKRPVQTSYFAKIKTFVQMFFIGFILILLFVKSTKIFSFDSEMVNNWLYSDATYLSMLIVTLFSVVTLIEYLYKSFSAKSVQN